MSAVAAMFRQKLLWTLGLVAMYAVAATLADFVINIVVLKTPNAFTPGETAMIAVLIGGPVTYYLISQRMDLKQAIQARDRTSDDLRHTSAELATSEERYRLLADRSPDVIIRYDTQGRVEYLSPSARRYGWDPDNLADANLASSLDRSEHERGNQFLDDLAAGRERSPEQDNVWRARTPSGEIVYFEGRSSPIRADDGSIIGAVAALRDVTERRQAAEFLEQSERKLRGLFQLAPVGIALTDMDGRYIEFNEAFRETCGYDDDELKALDYWALTPPEYADDEAAQLESLAKTGRYGPYEKEYVRKDGSRVPLRLSGILIDGLHGQQMIWSIVEDISAQRRGEAVLIDARNAAEAASIAKSEFLSNMSHEIRTPLTGVVGFAGLLQGMTGLPTEAQRYAARIAASAEALMVVVNDVLDFSKLEAGQMELDPHPFDLGALVETVADLYRDRAADKGLQLNIAPHSAAPVLLADSARLRQVLLNLVGNAIKFTDAGQVGIAAGYDANAGRLRIAVSDTGIGIPPDQASHLFQRFSQLDASSTRAHGGTGLGLAICKSLVEMMHGEIGLESAPGQGSTFWFEVPAPVAEAASLAPAAQPTARVEGHLRALVVDDVPVNRELVSVMLSPFDISITEAASGQEAVNLAMLERFDLILMDLQMPGMDGIAAAKAIRANAEPNRDTPILALSANVLPSQVAQCLAAGMNDHVSKPIRPAELLGKIAQWTSPSDAPADRAAES